MTMTRGSWLQLLASSSRRSAVDSSGPSCRGGELWLTPQTIRRTPGRDVEPESPKPRLFEALRHGGQLESPCCSPILQSGRGAPYPGSDKTTLGGRVMSELLQVPGALLILGGFAGAQLKRLTLDSWIYL